MKATNPNRFKVERGIPTPSGYGSRNKYPFGDMKVGDSFFVSYDKAENLRSAASYFGVRHKQKFVVRKPTNGEDGLRCWRVK